MSSDYTGIPKFRTLAELQGYQDMHDKNFHEDIYHMLREERLRHMAQHLTKISGRFADYFDKLDHGDEEDARSISEELKKRRIPDLLAFTLAISNILEINLEDSYFERIRNVEKEKTE